MNETVARLNAPLGAVVVLDETQHLFSFAKFLSYLTRDLVHEGGDVENLWKLSAGPIGSKSVVIGYTVAAEGISG